MLSLRTSCRIFGLLVVAATAPPAMAQEGPTVLYPVDTDPAAPASELGPLEKFNFSVRTTVTGLPLPPPPKPTLAERERWAERQTQAARQADVEANDARTLVLKPAVGRSGPSDLLRLAREQSRRSFPFYVPNADDVSSLRLTSRFRNSADVLPEASYYRVEINGDEITQLNSAAVTGFADLEVDVDPNVLERGRNVLTLEATHAHRVDCSVTGTYDLWTEVDVAETALDLQYDGGVPSIRRGNLNAWLRSGAFNGNPVRVLNIPGRNTDRRQTWTAHVAQGLGLRSTTQPLSFRTDTLPAPPPDLDVAESPFSGIASSALAPGLYVLVGQRQTLRPLIGERLASGITGPHVSVHTLGSGARGVLIVSGRTPADVSTAAARFAGVSGTPEVPIPEPERTPLLGADSERTFGELGHRSRPYYGLAYEETVRFRLPTDLFGRREQESMIQLDYSYGPNLGADARLLLEVNGDVVATQRLDDGDGATVEDQTVRLQMTQFRPGENTLRVVAELPAASENACPQVAGDHTGAPPRFQLAESSTIRFDYLSQLYALPDLHTTASTGYPYSRGVAPVPLVLTSASGQELSAALTFVSQLRRHSDRSFPVRAQTAPAEAEDGDSIVVGELESLSPELLEGAPLTRERIRALMATPGAARRAGAGRASGEPGFFDRWVPEWLRGPSNRQFGENPNFAAFGVIMQYERPGGDGRTRTVLTVPDGANATQLARMLAKQDLWQRLGGTATVFDRTGDNVIVYPPRARYYRASGDVDVGSAMLIAGEWMSARIILVAIAVLIVCMLFGYVLFNLLETSGRGTYEQS